MRELLITVLCFGLLIKCDKTFLLVKHNQNVDSLILSDLLLFSKTNFIENNNNNNDSIENYIQVTIDQKSISNSSGKFEFPNTENGTKSEFVAVKIQNIFSESIEIKNIFFSGTNKDNFNFESSFEPILLETNETYELLISFNPTSVNSESLSILNISIDLIEDDLFSFILEGTGIYKLNPTLSVFYGITKISNGFSEIQFPDTQLGSSSLPVSFTIKNEGNTDLQFTITLEDNSQFSLVTQPTSLVISSGSSGEFSLKFNPTQLGTDIKTKVVIYTNDLNNDKFTFSITGNVVDTPLSEIEIYQGLIPITSNDSVYTLSETVPGSSSKEYSFTIENIGQNTLTINSISLTGSDSGEFSISQLPSSSISAGGESFFKLLFKPTSIGAKEADVVIINNDSNEGAFQFTIKGTATNNVCDQGLGVENTILFYSYSSDQSFSKYNIRWINFSNSEFELDSNMISSITSEGIGSVRYFKNKIIFVNSLYTGSLNVYDPDTKNQISNSLGPDTYPQQISICNNKAYVTLDKQDVVRVYDLSNLPSISTLKSISVGSKPTDISLHENLLYVSNNDGEYKSSGDNQSTVSIINPFTETEDFRFNSGENTECIDMSPTGKLFSYNGGFTFTSNTFRGFTSFDADGKNTYTLNSSSGFTPIFGGKLAFNDITGFILLSDDQDIWPASFRLFELDFLTNSYGSQIDTDRYYWVGKDLRGKYFFKVKENNPVNNNLKVIIEDRLNNVLGSIQIPKNTYDLKFWGY